MSQLVKLLIRYHEFIIFLMIETAALVLLLNQRYQKAVFMNATSSLTGSYFSVIDDINGYLSLKSQNEFLMQENARLKTLVYNYPELSEDLLFFEQDTSVTVFPARIISGQISGKYNYFVINKGKNEGVKEGAGVITGNNIAGIIINVSDHYALMLPVINRKTKISAKIKKNGYKASIIWNGEDYRYAILQDIPNHLKLEKGDTIVTSGFSFYFPENLLIGTIAEYYETKGENFNYARIKLATDYSKLQNIEIFNDFRKREVDSLLNLTPEASNRH